MTDNPCLADKGAASQTVRCAPRLRSASCSRRRSPAGAGAGCTAAPTRAAPMGSRTATGVAVATRRRPLRPDAAGEGLFVSYAN